MLTIGDSTTLFNLCGKCRVNEEFAQRISNLAGGLKQLIACSLRIIYIFFFIRRTPRQRGTSEAVPSLSAWLPRRVQCRINSKFAQRISNLAGGVNYLFFCAFPTHTVLHLCPDAASKLYLTIPRSSFVSGPNPALITASSPSILIKNFC